MANALLQTTANGLYCSQGGFFVDPWRPVERAIITHGHRDHLCDGSEQYLTVPEGEPILRARLGAAANIDTVAYGKSLQHNGVTITLHPAGHILGSAQIRLEYRGEIWVVSGDYKLQPDPTCAPYVPVSCHVFITEATFGLPIYRWPSAEEVFAEINSWWRFNQSRGRASLVYCYALGKAQRILAGIDPSIGPIFGHGAVQRMNGAYRQAGVSLAETLYTGTAARETDWTRALILAPLSARGSPWTRRFGPLSTGLASGWMRIRGTRRRRAIDRGFVLSDHADWPGLGQAIRASGAQRVGVTHGYAGPVTRWLREQGLEAEAIATPFAGEAEEADLAADEEKLGT